MTVYPDGYGTAMVTLQQMTAKHGGKMHPEFARRFFAYMEHKGGLLGVGGGWRSTQPSKPGFAPDGKSFHQDQRFASGFVGYAAVDLVVPVPGGRHRAPAWGETSDAPEWGLHTFIKRPEEPWHIQCVEMRGWQTWVNAGRPDPEPFTLPGSPTPPPAPPPEGATDMIILDLNPGTNWWVAMVLGNTELTHLVNGHHVNVLERGGVPRVTVNETEMDGILRSVKTTNLSPFRAGMASHNASLDTLWIQAA